MTPATCAAPGCGASLAGRRPDARYCSDRCRKNVSNRARRAQRAQARPARPRVPVPRAPRAPRAPSAERPPAVDPDEYARDLEREAERSLREDPARWRHARAGSLDEYRRKPTKPDSRGRRP